MANKKKSNRGRPKGTKASRTRGKPIQFKAYPEEDAAYQLAAEQMGLTKSAWIRVMLNSAVAQGKLVDTNQA